MAAQRVPVAPGGVPGLGHGPQLVRRPLEFVTSLREQGDVVLVRVGRMPLYALTDPALVRRILTSDHASFGRGRLFERGKRIVGYGLITAEGGFHRRQRHLMQPIFTRPAMSGHTDTVRRIAVAVTQTWSPGQRVAVDSVMNDLALTAVARVLFSSDVAREAVEVIRRCVPVILRALFKHMLLPMALTSVPTPARLRFRTAHAQLHTIIDQMIAAYRVEGGDRGDLLSRLLAARDEHTGEIMSEHQVHDEVLAMFFAGVDATGAMLAWVFHELGQHPDIERRVHEEIDAVLDGNPVGYSDLAKLEYTGRVITETFRRYSPWFFPRGTLSPLELGGVHLPAGTDVMYSPYALHHDPRFFPEPDCFDPDRWLPDRAKTVPRGAFIPFGAGAHRCIGESLAVIELTVAVATITARWRLAPIAGTRVRKVATVTVHPDRLPMIAHPR
ncbi:MAG: cytochrome P450 [Pseudonocardiaceae bacterium]